MGKGDVVAPGAVFCDLAPDARLNQQVRELLAGLGYRPVAFSGAHAAGNPRTSLDRDYEEAFENARLLIFWFPAGRTRLSWVDFVRGWSPRIDLLAYVEAGGVSVDDVKAVTGVSPRVVADKAELLACLARDVPEAQPEA